MSKPAYRVHVSHYSSVVVADVTAPYWLFVCFSVHTSFNYVYIRRNILLSTTGYHTHQNRHSVVQSSSKKKICAFALPSVAENNRGNKTIH